MVELIRLQINGIRVYREREHYLLRKNGIEMRCYIGELNECLQEFQEYIEEIEQERQLA